jgi:hypothetical protein
MLPGLHRSLCACTALRCHLFFLFVAVVAVIIKVPIMDMLRLFAHTSQPRLLPRRDTHLIVHTILHRIFQRIDGSEECLATVPCPATCGRKQCLATVPCPPKKVKCMDVEFDTCEKCDVKWCAQSDECHVVAINGAEKCVQRDATCPL